MRICDWSPNVCSSDVLVHILDFPDPIARDELARLGERSVDHRAARAVEGDALAGRRGLEPVAVDHHPGIDEFLVELAHRLEHLGNFFGRRPSLFAVFGRFPDIPPSPFPSPLTMVSNPPTSLTLTTHSNNTQ